MSDIRSTSIEHNRESERKAKWARGEAWGPGRSKDAHGAPVRVKPRFPRSNQEMGVKGQKTAQRHEIIDETFNSHSDSSGDEMPNEPSAAPDAEIAYSFDAAKGPTHGSTVLSIALAQAVERFENTVTEKLVKDEYDVLQTEDVVTPMKKSGKRSVLVEEDDYEFI